jgi:glycosyltransferase involved in cell wall biosynthesis
MNIISLSDLPPSPMGQIGWPWNVAPSPQPSVIDNESRWPRISIVTPSYNQVQFLEETIRSVLLQGYPNLEYIIMDGASTDGSLEILHRYSSFFDYWISARDDGHASALNAGFDHASGDILGYINSDDLLLPDALFNIARYFRQNPQADLVVGKSVLINSASTIYYRVPGLIPTFYSLLFWGSGGFNQPASFWKRDLFLSVGPFDPAYRFSFDFDMYLRFTLKSHAKHINQYLAAFRMHPKSKTITLRDVQEQDDAMLRQRYGINHFPKWIRKLAWSYYMLRCYQAAGILRLKTWFGLEQPIKNKNNSTLKDGDLKS